MKRCTLASPNGHCVTVSSQVSQRDAVMPCFASSDTHHGLALLVHGEMRAAPLKRFPALEPLVLGGGAREDNAVVLRRGKEEEEKGKRERGEKTCNSSHKTMCPVLQRVNKAEEERNHYGVGQAENVPLTRPEIQGLLQDV